MTSGNIADTTYATTDLSSLLADVADGCTNCSLCVRECSFLQSHGTPRTIAERCTQQQEAYLSSAFSCHLCGLCSAVCPQPIDPAKLFLTMRQEAFQRGIGEFGKHSPLRNYENIGTSRRFTWYGLPDNCTTVFFPGCSLSGTRSETVKQTFSCLQGEFPNLGIVLDCCTKPSHDLGNRELFHNRFSALKNSLLKHGITSVLTACPNCFEVFSRYAPELVTRSVYTILNHIELPQTAPVTEYVTVHDPCVARYDSASQTAVRELLWKKGLTVREMPHSKNRTLCCGQGGGVAMLDQRSSKAWTAKRLAESEQHRIVNYCASCAQLFASHTKSNHILDLLFNPEQVFAGRITASRAPWTYLNRLHLKRDLQRTLQVTFSFERTPTSTKQPWLVTVLKKPFTLSMKFLLFVIFGRDNNKAQETD